MTLDNLATTGPLHTMTNGLHAPAPPAEAEGERAGQPDLAALSRVARDPDRTLGRVLETAREQLEMDIAYITAFRDGQLVHECVEGDGESFGLTAGVSIGQEESVCRRVVAGEVAEVLPAVRSEPVLSDLTVIDEARIGSYVGVPIRLSDGTVYGTLCCASHAEDPTLGERDARFMHVLAGLVGEQLEREQVERENHRLQVEAAGAGALVAALEARDHYTGDHSIAVVELAGAVARQLRLTPREIAEVEQVALLHDIGKVGIPDAILQKPGPLSEEEWVVMRTHPTIGERVIASISGLSHLAPAIRAEHERWDGGGYPDGLAGAQIPFASRIVLACDAYHAMTSDRPYRRALSHDQAIAELRAGSGTQFCPATVPAILRAVAGRAERRAA